MAAAVLLAGVGLAACSSGSDDADSASSAAAAVEATVPASTSDGSTSAAPVPADTVPADTVAGTVPSPSSSTSAGGEGAPVPTAVESTAVPTVPPDDPEPAESVASTLCNLTSEHFAVLRELAVANDFTNLELAALSLSDDLAVWDGLRGHFPETNADIERAARILGHWRAALNDQAESDRAQMAEQFALADAEIAELPSAATYEELECNG